MPQVSRRPLKKETENRITDLFFRSVTLCASAKQAADFIDELLTPTEKIMLIKRLAIAYLLLGGYSYDMIGSALKVSRTTVGMVSLKLQTKGNGMRAILESLRTDKKRGDFFSELGDVVIDVLGKGKGSNWKLTNEILSTRKRERRASL